MHRNLIVLLFVILPIVFSKAQVFTSLEEALDKKEQVKVLDLSKQDLTILNSDVLELSVLEVLKINNNELERLPTFFSVKLTKLKKMEGQQNQFQEHSIGGCFRLGQLQYLDLSYNPIKSLKSISDVEQEITNVEVLKVSHAEIEKVGEELALLPNLKYLDLSHNKINYFAGELFTNLQDLDTLILSDNQFYFLTLDSLSTSSLRYIDLSHNPNIWGIHDLLNRLPKLEYLNASYVGDNTWQGMSFGLAKAKKYYKNSSLKTLNLSHAHLSKLPKSMGCMENLEILDLSHNNIEKIPRSFKKLQKLKKIDLRHNPLSEKEKKKVKRLLPNCEFVF